MITQTNTVKLSSGRLQGLLSWVYFKASKAKHSGVVSPGVYTCSIVPLLACFVCPFSICKLLSLQCECHCVPLVLFLSSASLIIPCFPIHSLFRCIAPLLYCDVLTREGMSAQQMYPSWYTCGDKTVISPTSFIKKE